MVGSVGLLVCSFGWFVNVGWLVGWMVGSFGQLVNLFIWLVGCLVHLASW